MAPSNASPCLRPGAARRRTTPQTMIWLLALGVLGFGFVASSRARAGISDADRRKAADAVVARHGESARARAELGVRQVAERWWDEDGDAGAFQAFCAESFTQDPEELRKTFLRLQDVMEQVEGRLHEIRREITSPLELDTGPVLPVDRLLARLDLGSHLTEDLFKTQVAFLALLNYPVHTLDQRLKDGPGWDRETWARSRMMDSFAARIPAPVGQRVTRAFTEASNYIDAYNIRMDRLVTPDGRRPFPEGLRLISHWGLRDELASHYGRPGGLERQRLIYRVMQRIVRQEIPALVVDNPEVLWDPEGNVVLRAATGETIPEPAREPDTRYARLLEVFHAVRAVDPYTPTAPSFIQRRFEWDRQIPEAEVERLLARVLASEEVRRAAAEIRRRLGRDLEPFDIWYSGFESRGAYSEEELDAIVRARYPNVEAFQKDLPNILTKLGFSDERARWLADHIVVDPSRGAGHALGAVRRQDKAHLRTRFGPNGMDYKGYNIAIHELGHNVEQVFSLYGIDHWFLNGVPNNAFTEALAFVFQQRDLELLGLAPPSEETRHLATLATLWNAYEIGGVSMVDMQVWRWMYAHPDATPAELREATLGIARDVWNRYFAPVFGVRDQEILAIYSHMIAYGLYLPDYPIGHIIAFQLAEKLQGERFGEEFERVARQGRLTPDAWMRGAVGSPIAPDALLKAARRALDAVAPATEAGARRPGR